MEEAEFIVSRIRTLMIRESLQFQDFGVLLRANHLTRALEEVVPQGEHPLRRLGRHELLRAPGGARHAGLPEARCQPRRRHQPPAHRQHAAAGHRQEAPGAGRRARRGAPLLAVFRHRRARATSTGSGSRRSPWAAAAEFTGDGRGVPREVPLRRKASWPQALRELVEEIDYWGHLVSENKDARDKDVVKWKFGNVESLIGSIADFEEDPDAVSPSLFDYLARVSLASRDDLDASEDGRAGQPDDHPRGQGPGVSRGVRGGGGKGHHPARRARWKRRMRTSRRSAACSTWPSPGRRKRLFLTFCSSRRRMGKPVECVPLAVPRRASRRLPFDARRRQGFRAGFPGCLEEDRRDALRRDRKRRPEDRRLSAPLSDVP